METEIFKRNRASISKDIEFTSKFKTNKRNFKQFVETYKKDIYTYFLLLSQDESEAFKQTKMLFVKAYYRISSFKDSDSFKKWLFKKMFYISKKLNNPEVSKLPNNLEDDREYYDLEGDGTVISYETINLDEKPDKIKDAGIIMHIISDVEFSYKSILILRDILKMDVKFISYITGLTEGTVQSRLAEVRMKFANNAHVLKIERRKTL